MKNIIRMIATLLCMQLMCFQLIAEERKIDYWSLGSFDKLINAINEKNRLTDMTGLAVRIAVFPDSDRTQYRLVVEKDGTANQQQIIADAGAIPWTLPVSANQLAMSDEELERTQVRLEGRQYFLVLAGFRAEFRADRFLASLSEDGVTELRIQTSSIADAPWYRIMHGPFGSAQASVSEDFKARGLIDAWWVRGDPEKDDKLERVLAAEIVSVVEPIVEPVEEKSPAKLNPPQAGESYFEYCVEKANDMERAVYCSDGFFRGLIVVEKKIKDDGSIEGKDSLVLAQFCVLKASGVQRQQYCAD